MPNNKEYQDAYNKLYYQANKEYLNKRREENRKKKLAEKKPRVKIIEQPNIIPKEPKVTVTDKLKPQTTQTIDDSIKINHGNFIISW
jgi:hypothetical protein